MQYSHLHVHRSDTTMSEEDPLQYLALLDGIGECEFSLGIVFLSQPEKDGSRLKDVVGRRNAVIGESGNPSVGVDLKKVLVGKGKEWT
jgi:hypothetical protein